MPITDRDISNRRIWSEEFINSFDSMSVEDRYTALISGLEESGFVLESMQSLAPISNLTDLCLGGHVVVRLYLVELGGDYVICYRVGVKGGLDEEDTDTIFKLSLHLIWEDIRRVWGAL
jgi:hypothetical protein